jgi:hypothetical protein
MSQSLGHVTSQSPCQILTGASAGLAPRLGKRAGQLGETWNSAAAAPRQPRRRPQRWCRPTGSHPPSLGCTGLHTCPPTCGDHATLALRLVSTTHARAALRGSQVARRRGRRRAVITEIECTLSHFPLTLPHLWFPAALRIVSRQPVASDQNVCRREIDRGGGPQDSGETLRARPDTGGLAKTFRHSQRRVQARHISPPSTSSPSSNVTGFDTRYPSFVSSM